LNILATKFGAALAAGAETWQTLTHNDPFNFQRTGLASGNDCVGTRLHSGQAQSSLRAVSDGDARHTADSNWARRKVEILRRSVSLHYS
jgi:hypothetical protein